MANKLSKYTFGGINQDISKSKHQPEFYFEGQHIRIVSTDTQSTGSVTNEKGNDLVIVLPRIEIVSKINPLIQAIANSYTLLVNSTLIMPILNNDVFVYPVTITILQQPTKGSLVINSDKTVTYTNIDGIVGTDTFIYQINDGYTTSSATVTLLVQATVVQPELPPDEVPTIDSNFDGTYYYYIFAPCNINLTFRRVKSNIKITDNRVYSLLGSGNIGYEGKISQPTTNMTATSYTIGAVYGTTCPPIDDNPYIPGSGHPQ